MPFKTDERICLNADRSAVVSCDSPAAAWQLAMPGDEVSDEDASKYGLGKKREPAEEKAVEAAPQNKARLRAAKK